MLSTGAISLSGWRRSEGGAACCCSCADEEDMVLEFEHGPAPAGLDKAPGVDRALASVALGGCNLDSALRLGKTKASKDKKVPDPSLLCWPVIGAFVDAKVDAALAFSFLCGHALLSRAR